MPKQKSFDLVGSIMAYESGELNNEGILELFAELIKSGQAWSLQGSYGRTAQALIDKGLINREGVINWDLFQELSCG
jgi:hypothetical protein